MSDHLPHARAHCAPTDTGVLPSPQWAVGAPRPLLALALALSLVASMSLGMLGAPAAADFDDRRGGPVRLPAEPSGVVLESLRPNLVAHYDFEHPVPGDPATEQDLGFSGTPLWLVNGGAEMRVPDGAYPASAFSMQTQPQPGDSTDWKAGIFDADGVESLNAFNAASEITLMGWFKMTGDHPSPGYGAAGFSGILSGDSEGHLVRALIELITVDGELRLVALGNRIDGGTAQIFAAEEDWRDLVPRGEWVHLAATFDYDNGTMELYRNGEPLEGFYTEPGDPWEVDGPGPHTTSPTDPTGIKIGGSYPQSTVDRNPCDCRMDDLMFIDRVVTADEMREQYERFLQAPTPATTAQAGSIVPVELELPGGYAADQLTMTSTEVSCETGQAIGDSAKAATPGSTGVSSARGGDVHRFRWQTDADWSQTCRRLFVTVDDGSTYSSLLHFR
jgi:hypothetical protein